ncbi:MAG: CRISPR system precrRNA processing endoribonuclease RAMP protein Cas6 [Gammaproteobacteria bacterium]
MNSINYRMERHAGNSVPIPRIPVAHYRFSFKCDTFPPDNQYLGSAWRGALGHALRRTVCVTGLPECDACLLYRSCSYPYLFETPPPVQTQKMRRYTAAPHPFIIVLPPSGMDRDDTGDWLLELVLIGHAANQQLAYLIHALKEAGRQGITSARLKMELTGVAQAVALPPRNYHTIYQAPEGHLEPLPITAPECPPVRDIVHLQLHTPFRFKKAGNLVTAETLGFPDLFGALLRRISMLSYFHTDTPFEIDFRRLIAATRHVETVSKELRWHDWTRYSTRQRTTMQLGGVVGTIIFRGPEMEQFWPCLWAGQWLHAGKATSMGLGRYTIQETASLPERTAAVR